MSEKLVPTLWLKRLYGAECKPTGECYDIAFSKTQGYSPLYEIPADQVLVPRELLERIANDDEGMADLSDFEELKRLLHP